MRRYILTLFVIALLAFPSLSMAQGFDIRKVRWGMTRTEVVASEKGTTSQRQRDSSGMIVFDDIVFENSAIILYVFNKKSDLLESVTILLYQNNSSSASAFFNALDSSLKKAYRPVEDARIAPADSKLLKEYANNRTRVTLTNIYKKEKMLSLRFAELK